MCLCCRTFVGNHEEAVHLVKNVFGEEHSYLDPFYVGNVIHMSTGA